MINTRMSQTITATKTGTTCVRPSLISRLVLVLACRAMATETPHQVSVALKPAARSQAPKRYQTSAGSSRPRSGVKMRAMPAKSMAQKAMASTIDQRMPDEGQVAKNIAQGELGGAEVEDLEGRQGADDHQAPGCAAAEAAAAEQAAPECRQTIANAVHGTDAVHVSLLRTNVLGV